MTREIINEIIHSEDELRSLLGFPSELVNNKVIRYLDKHCCDFISKSPLIFVATSDSSGHCDVSPRGDEAGFVLVLGEKHLVIPERPGNRRFDSLKNMLENPQIGLIFIIPGLEETLRINGHASIIKDKEIMQKMESHGKTPVIGIAVEVEECFIHCAKAFKRSHIWDEQYWPEKEALPKAALILSEHAKNLGKSEEDVASALKESYEQRLY